jgi:IS5 family transposase
MDVVLDPEVRMTLGVANNQGDLLDDVARFCNEVLSEKSIHSFLRRERERLFGDHEFADLFERSGRRSVPPSVVAVVMVLQRLEGLSDREAVERYCFDNRWRYAAGVGGYDTNGWVSFSHTVLVDMRERLRNSTRPDRIFEAALGAAHEAGLVGRKRVLDSTPLYDAVATMDTITLIRSAIRGLLKVATPELRGELRSVLSSGDDYASSAKPAIDWDDPDAQAELIDSRAKDAYACLVLLEGRELDNEVNEAMALLATVVGQDLEEVDGTLRIARRVAKDRVISTVDPEARHGHKTSAHSFDGWKGHVAIDPDSEIITKTVVTAGNVGDASVAQELIEDLLEAASDDEDESESPREQDRATLYGDAAYGTGAVQSLLHDAGVDSKCKTQPPSAKNGLFAKDRFTINLENDTVVCPGEVTARIRRLRDGTGMAKFGEHCSSCALATQCTMSGLGRTVRVGVNEASLARARAEQVDPTWRDDYRATRPKVERKLAHLMRRRHGGRRARVRGTMRVDADFTLLAAAANLARLAVLGVQSTPRGWQLAGG